MKKHIIACIILIFSLGEVWGQHDSSTVYNNLDTEKYYSVSMEAYTSRVGNMTYKVNGKTVSKSKYQKYHATWKKMENCCPCILRSYNENNVLLREAVSCEDCGVGTFKKFYPNGNVELSGRYKENPTGNWEDIWNRGYCNVKDGQWTYFNERGDTLYSEFWEEGKFIMQLPAQNTTEIWKVDLLLNGEEVGQQLLTVEQLKELIVRPNFKNYHREDVELTIAFNVSAIGYKESRKTFTLATFKQIDVAEMLADIGIPSEKKAIFNLVVFNRGKVIANFYLNIKH